MKVIPKRTVAQEQRKKQRRLADGGPMRNRSSAVETEIGLYGRIRPYRLESIIFAGGGDIKVTSLFLATS